MLSVLGPVCWLAAADLRVKQENPTSLKGPDRETIFGALCMSTRRNETSLLVSYNELMLEEDFVL